ncbi:MAG TPA: hypothetical protein VER03_25955 [Bryobacteraceae bacterium]|nr:hypothetical protein [Bryobacteraceae bacterium]
MIRFLACGFVLVSVAFVQDQTPVAEADPQRLSNNRIYTSERALFRTTANALLVQAVSKLPPGAALDVAMGLGRNKWDLIVLAYFFPRDIVPNLREALRPGGLLLFEYYHKDAQRVRLIDGLRVLHISLLD